MHPLFQQPTPSSVLRAPEPPHPASRRNSSDAIAGTNFSALRQPRVRAQLGTPARCVPVGRARIESHGFRFLGVFGSRDTDVRGPNRKSFPWMQRAIESNGKRYAESDEGQINRWILDTSRKFFERSVAASRRPCRSCLSALRAEGPHTRSGGYAAHQKGRYALTQSALSICPKTLRPRTIRCLKGAGVVSVPRQSHRSRACPSRRPCPSAAAGSADPPARLTPASRSRARV